MTRAEHLRLTREENIRKRMNAMRPERYLEAVQRASDKRKLLKMEVPA